MAGRWKPLHRSSPALLLTMLPLLLLLLLQLPSRAFSCVGNNSIGSTIPRKEINLEPGQPFNITCVINPDHDLVVGYNADDLYFERKEVLATGVVRTRVPSSQITRLNSTAILMTARLDSEAKHIFQCFLNRRELSTTGVCMTDVNVGRPPQNVENFRCISYNWRNITCSWEEPFNAIKTRYDVQYRLPTLDFYEKTCTPTSQRPRNPLPGQTVRRSCVVPHHSFRSTHQSFLMTMNASNALGLRSLPPVTLETYAIILPAPPKSLLARNITSHGLRLYVNVDFPMYSFPEPIQFRVSYTSAWNSEPVGLDASSMRAVISHERRNRTLAVDSLVPYTNYTFSVQIKSSRAVGSDMWSQPATATFTTLPTIPAAPPSTTVGSFQLVGQVSSRTVYVYWRQIPDHQRNGHGFRYCVSAWRPDQGLISGLEPDEVTPAYARFSDVTLDAVAFHVTSCNDEGHSYETANLRVPARKDELPRPHRVTLLVAGVSQYQLSWEQRGPVQPDNYTIFWCQHMRDRPFQCQGQLGWKHVPGAVRSHSLQIAPGAEYQFAVAANKGGSSSGMAWSHCTRLANGEESQLGLELHVEERAARRLVLAWYGDCVSRAAVAQYVVYFCRLAGSRCQENETRLEPSKITTAQQNFTVTDLQPYSDYRFSVAVISRGKEGQRSAFLDVKTTEAQPDTPTAVKVSAVSNTSLTVRWSPPALSNGILDHYTVLVGDLPPVVVLADGTETTATNLTAFTSYDVSVKACNKAWNRVGCSPPSEPVEGRTLVGVPGPMEPPRTQLLNVSAARVHWKPPALMGGPEPVYQLRVVSERDGKNHTGQIPLPADEEVADLSIPECEPGSASQRDTFTIRAQVQLESGEELFGPWSEPAQQNCVLASDWPTATIVGVVMGGAFLMMLVVLVFFLVCSRTKKKLTEMRNLGVNLPPGLDRLEKPPLSSFPGPERRPGEGHSYGRLVSQNSAGTDRTNTSVSGQPLLQEDLGREECEGDGSDLTPPPHPDSNSCSSSATNYTDSGAECEKGAPSPTFKKFSWPAVSDAPSNITPYVQVGGPETSSPPTVTAAPAYSKFSPYVDAKGIQALMARSLEALPPDGSGSGVTRSVPDLAQGSGDPAEAPTALPYSQIGHRSSTGYVSMASDEGVASPRPSTGYHRLDAMPQAAPSVKLQTPTPAQAKAAPAKQPELKPYVTLGPPPPPALVAGFPPYVLAGPPGAAPEGPAPVGSCSPTHGGTSSPLSWASPRGQEVCSAPAAPRGNAKGTSVGNGELPAREVSSAGYVMRDKFRPNGIEMNDLPVSGVSSGYVSQEALRGDVTSNGEPVLSPKKLPTVATSRDPYCRVVTTHQGPPDLGPNVSMV